MRTEKRRKFIINSIYWLLVIALIYITVKYLMALVAPFVFAFAISFALKPVIRFLQAKLKFGKKLAAVVSVLLFFITIGALTGFAITEIFLFLKNLFLAMPQIYGESIAPALLSVVDGLREGVSRLDPAMVGTLTDVFNNVITSLGNVITGLSVNVVGSISSAATGVPKLLISFLLTVISTFFLASDYDNIVGFVLAQLSDKTKVLVLEVKRNITEILFKYVKSYSLIMLITLVELSIGLSILGVKNSILIAFLISIFDILPVLGTGGIMIPWIGYCLITGSVNQAVGLLVIYVIITVVRNIVEPKIIGKHVGLHPLATLMAMFVGTALFGIIGLFGLPISLAILNSLNANGAINIFKRS